MKRWVYSVVDYATQTVYFDTYVPSLNLPHTSYLPGSRTGKLGNPK